MEGRQRSQVPPAVGNNVHTAPWGILKRAGRGLNSQRQKTDQKLTVLIRIVRARSMFDPIARWIFIQSAVSGSQSFSLSLSPPHPPQPPSPGRRPAPDLTAVSGPQSFHCLVFAICLPDSCTIGH